MTHNKEKIKPIVAWAVINTIKNQIEYAAAFVDNECSCCEVTEAIAIYEKKKDLPGIYTSGYKKIKVRITPIK